MVGNKHKNGIICTFPNCNKPMRTQKFKMHFIRVHLRDGEVYSVEHRRQFEVAREENARSLVKPELVSVAAAPAMQPVMKMSTTGSGDPFVRKTNTEAASSVRENGLTSQAKKSTPVQVQQVPSTSQAETFASKSEEVDASASASTLHFVSVSENVPLSGKHASGRKRLASTVEASAEIVDHRSVILMQFIALMDQRFQELVGKMGEMIDVQKDLIDTLQASNPHGQPPTSAFSHAVDVVMKRRKKDTSAGSVDNNTEDVDGSSNTDTDGPPCSDFVL